MRKIVLVVLAVALLAGCANPNAQSSQAPSSTSTSKGIAVGEPNPGAPGGLHGGALVRPAHGENTTDGLRLVGDEDRSGFAQGGSVTFTYNASNVGADAITWGACYKPYAFELRDASGTLHPLEPPMAQCQAFTETPFRAGASLAFNATWDGTYAVGDHMQQAPQGQYTFTALFTAYRGEAKAQVRLDLPVSIVAPGTQ